MEDDLICDRCGKKILDEPSLQMDVHINLQINTTINAENKNSKFTSDRYLCRQCSLQCIHWMDEGRMITHAD